MTYRMRRKSMEQLELYDLDKLMPPPLPPPRRQRCHLPTDVAFQRYSFLCDMKRLQTDPIYASTPMFSVIPQQNKIKYHRQILGIRFPANIVKPIESTSSKDNEDEDEDSEEKKSRRLEHEEQSSEEEDEEENSEESEDDDDDNDESSSSESSDDDRGGGNNDDDDKGIVEQIFNRDKR